MSLADDWFEKAMDSSFDAFNATAVNTIGEILSGVDYVIKAHYKFRFPAGVTPECIRYRVSRIGPVSHHVNKGNQIYNICDIDYTDLCYYFGEEEIFTQTLKGNVIPFSE